MAERTLTYREGRKDFQAAHAFSNSVLLTVVGSHTEATQEERPFKMGKMITGSLRMGKPSAITLFLLTMRKSILQKSLMSEENVV